MPTKNTVTEANSEQITADAPADVNPLGTGRRGNTKSGENASKSTRGTDRIGQSTKTPVEAKAAGAAGSKNDGVLGQERTGRSLLPDNFAGERDDVLTVINELEDQLDRYEEIRETLERELTEAHEQNQTAKQRVQELEWQAVTLQTRVEALEQVRQEVTLLEEEIADANTRAQRLSEQFSRSEKESSRIAGELKAAEKQLEELWSARKERDGLRVDIKSVTAKFEHIERAHKDVIEERNTLQTGFQEAQASLEEMRTEKHGLEMSLRAADDRAEELLRLQEETQQKIETLRNEKKNFQAQLTHVERENARVVEQQQFYECELTSLRSMNRNAEAALTNVKKAFSEVRVALAETKSRARRRAIETWPRTCGTLRGVYDTCDSNTGTPPGDGTSESTPTGDASDEVAGLAVTESGG